MTPHLQPETPVLSIKLLLPLLAAIIAMSPLAIDLYLPAMPIIAEQFGTSIKIVQNTLSVYLLGYALGLLFFGPISDVNSRRKLVLLGVGGFFLISLALPMSQSIEQFMVLRFFQAFISSAATVVVPGTIREHYGENSAKGFSYVAMIMMVAPMIAPSIGSALLLLHSWQLIFYVLSGYCLLVFVLVLKFLPEVVRTEPSKKLEFLSRYIVVLSNRKAHADLASVVLISLAFFAYITAIPFVYLTVFEVSEYHFSVLFGVNVLFLMTAHFINTRFVGKLGSRRMLMLGLTVSLITSSALFLVTYLELPLYFTVATILPLMGSFSIVAVNSEALVLMRFAKNPGTATAVMGTLRFSIGALAGPILTYFYNATALPFAILMWCSVLLVVAIQFYRWYTD